MNRSDHLITILKEECGEVILEGSKCLRFGLDEIYPPIGITNRDRLVKELNDIVAMTQLLVEDGLLPADWMNQDLIDGKKKKVEQYLVYSRKLGRLT